MTRMSVSTKEQLETFSDDRAELLQLLLDQKSGQTQKIQPFARSESVDGVRLPVSWAQQRLWFIDKLEGGGAAYHIPVVADLRGELDQSALRKALDALVERHEVLRTVFVNVEGDPQQHIAEAGNFALALIDLSNLPHDDRSEQLRTQELQEAHAPFDLGAGPLVRGRLLRLSPDEHVLLVTMHHIISDGWSMSVFFRELGELYTAFSIGLGNPLQALPIQYADYAQWQRQWLRGVILDEQLSYWRARLTGATPQLDLPTDRPRPAVQSYRGDNVHVVFDSELVAQLRAIANRHEMTLFMVVYGAWAILLSRLSGQDDVVIGTPVANREWPELESLIGFFVNTVVLRAEVHGELTLSDFLKQVKETTLGAFDHQDVPFEQVVESLQPQRSLSRNPIFQVMLALQDTPKGDLLLGGLTGNLKEGVSQSAMFDLLLTLEERGAEIVGRANYATDLFDREKIERWMAYFAVLLKSIVDNESDRIADLSILPDGQRQELLGSFSAIQDACPQEQAIPEIFEAQVARAPNAVAVTFEGQSLTYGDLNRRANQLARYLQDKGVGPDQLVGVCVERSLDMVVALLGVLKAGGAYVPLDPNYPTERLQYMLTDAAPRVLLTQEKFKETLPVADAAVISLDSDWSEIAKQATDDLTGVVRPHHLAYVIYTSGSTGKPKGVMVEHGNVTRLFAATDRWFAFNERDVWTLFHSFAFDFSVWELWGALLYGGRVVVVPYLTARSPQDFYRLLCAEGVTVLNQTPSAFTQLSQAQEQSTQAHSLRVVVFGGEALELRSLRPWVKRNGVDQPQLVNMYGITETTVHVTYRLLTASEIESERGSLIGKTIPDLQAYLLDSSRQPVPIGVAGELYIGGAGVARGYLNRPELTAERFIEHPFSTDPQARLYKTGDLGRWRPDGSLEYLGRNDDQVKIRGFRIELGEIEAQLARHGQVKEAVVLAREDVPGEKRLVAYLTSRAGTVPRVEDLRAHLKSVLPEHMIPSAFVSLDSLPLTSNGKLDKRALPAPDLGAFAAREYEAPQGEVEEILAGIWQSLLRIERVGRQNNFFELGGHSLLIVQMLERLRHVGLSADVRVVFESPTLADLASALTSAVVEQFVIPPNLIPSGCDAITPQMLSLMKLDEGQIERIVKAVPGGALNIKDIYPLAPLQEGILFHHLLMEQGGDAYVLPMLLSLSSYEKVREFVAALQGVIDRHDILRTAVLWEQLPRPVQVVHRKATLPVDTVVLDGNRDAAEQVTEWLKPEKQRLDLRQAPLMRLQVAADPGSEQWYAMLQIHHIVDDATSLKIVISEVVAHLEGHAESLPESVPYRNHVAQALEYAEKHDAELFFREKLADIDEPTAPFGLLDVHGDGSHVEEAREELDLELSQRARSAARRLSVSAATLFHAAWSLVVAHTSGRDDVVFGSVLLGRLQGSAGAQRILGMFINTLPLRLNLQGITAKELVEKAQRGLIELLSHEQASLAVAQRCSGLVGSAPLFSAILNFRHSIPDTEADLDSANGIRVLAGQERTNYPITFSVDDLGDHFALTTQTDWRINPRQLTGLMHTAVRSLVEALEQEPQTPALALSVLPVAELNNVVRGFNSTAGAYPREKLIHGLFEEQVKRTPNAIAVMHEGRSLTYADLNKRANQLAHYLAARGVGPGQLTAICVERGVDMVIGLLGILKAGCAYVPLDPNYPSERLQHMLEDADPQVVLTQENLKSILPTTQAEIIALDTKWAEILNQATENLSARERGLTSQNRVYVIYTSGSTGRPKGTAMLHRSMVNLIEWHRAQFAAGEGARVLQFAALSFDVAFQETFSTLCTGGVLVLLDEWIRRDARALIELLTRHGIERLFVPPMMLQSIADSFKTSGAAPPGLRDVITAGEQLRVTPEIVSFFRHLDGCRLHNHYGPTETHVVTALTLDGDSTAWPALPTIGRPIANIQIYVLDKRLKPTPLDIAGEIYIGGAGVAQGYLGRPELTTQRFVNDPYSSDPHARLYKTGDLGRWRPDGTVEYLGRNDDQVKIRGFRIELGEIEGQLLRHSLVKEAVVLAREDIPGEKRLVAYITSSDDSAPTAEDLRSYLKTALPDHMVPSAFVTLDSLPLTPSGKLDKRALPAPELGAYASRAYEAPLGEKETVLARIWQDLLRVERVGRRDNFFELGGHSLLIVQMMERLRQTGLSAEIRRVFKSPTLADLAVTVTGGSAEQIVVPPNLIAADCAFITPGMLPLVDLEAEHIARIVETVPGGAVNIQDIYPLAPLQDGILFHHLLNRNDTYARPLLFSLSSRQKLADFVQALQHVIDRHDVLRTAVLWEQLPRSVQVVYRRAVLPVEELTLDPDRSPIDQLRERMNPEHQKLDLRQAPLMRLHTAADPQGSQWYALLQTHHLVFDNESLQTMLAEVMACVDGRGDSLPKPMPYRNYVAQALSLARTNDAESFFREKLSEIDEPTAPFGLLDVHGDGSESKNARLMLESEITQRLRVQARRFSVSAATVFHAAWGLVVARTSGRNDVVYGSVLLGRLQGSAGAQRILGMFINTLPLRLQLPGISARELVENTQRELADLLTHEQASLAVAQRCSGIAGSAPLFSTLLNYRQSATDPDSELTSTTGVTLLASEGRTNYPITLSVDDVSAGFALEMETDRRIDPEQMLGYVSTAVRSLVESLEQSPETPALLLRVLPVAETDQVLREFNATSVSYHQQTLIHELFEAHVARSPNTIAVTQDGEALTYAELNGKANQLAHFLREQGIGPDRLVAVCAERSVEMVVGLLAILKAGGGYVPLDPAYPIERLDYMLSDASPQIVLVQEKLRSRLPDTSAEVFALDAYWNRIVQQPSLNLDSAAAGLRPHHLAYVIYTSGSTGKPKGVMVSHRNVGNLLHWHCATFDIKAGSRSSSVAAVGFDATAWEIWSPLGAGATLVLAPASVSNDAEALVSWWANEVLDFSFMPTPMAEIAFSRNIGNENLRTLGIGGDRLRVRPKSHSFQLINNYGPTESTVIATAGRIDDSDTVLHIGRPIANTQIYILDSYLQPLPVGVAGEMYIGGAGVARGYLNRPELTNERFVADPFSDDPSARLYKSGDLCRWQPDGTIEYLGRNDQQVKIRGFRIELGEIEAQLSRHDQVREAVVIAREDAPGEKRLVAYLVSATDIALSLEDLRADLKSVLPDYMVPSAFVLLERLPLTSNGKLDRKALPAPEGGAYASQQYEPPQGEVEEILSGIWQELLRVERVGRQDNFFELGGHSLLIVQMLERLRRVGLSAEVRRVFQSPTLADLASALTSGSDKAFVVPPNLIPAGCDSIHPEMLPLVELESEHIERIARAVPGGTANIQDIYPLAPLQEGILFHHLMNQHGADTYARPMLLSLVSQEKLDAFVLALQHVMNRHDILRTSVLWEELPRPVQVVYRHADLPVETLALDPDRDAIEQLTEQMRSDQYRLDLRWAPLMRLQVAADPQNSRWFALLRTHHLVFDNASLQTLLAEVMACVEGHADNLPEPVAYRGYVAQALAQVRTDDSEAFFRGKLSDIDEPTAPFGLLDVHGDGSQVDEAHEELDLELSQRARKQARRLGVSAATLFHAAWSLVIARTSGRDDVVFGSVLLGRLQSSASSQRVLGMFINTLPLRLRLRDVTARELVEQAQRELVELLSHEQASLAAAQRCSGITGSAPLFSALLNYRHSTIGFESQEITAQGVTLLSAEGRTNYPIVLSVDDLGERFVLAMETDRRIDPHRMLGYMTESMSSLVETLEKAPLTPVLSLLVLPRGERDQVIELFNPIQTAVLPQKALIHELFEKQVALAPNAIAVTFESVSLTYGQLNARANQLARYLREKGVRADQRIGIAVERGLEMVVGLLGILKAGGTYVPLDPNYPVERLQYMLSDAAPSLVLTQERLREKLPTSTAEIVSLDADWNFISRQSADNVDLGESVRPHHLAYVIYTSGSTGNPKGVMVEHGNVTRLFASTNEWFGFNKDDVWTLFHPYAFDFSVWELWGALLYGGRVVVVPYLTARSPQEFYRLVCAEGVTVLNQTPSAFAQFISAQAENSEQLHSLRVVIFGGEALELHTLRPWVDRNGADEPQLVNMYGITETTVHVTYRQLSEVDIASERSSLIGRPIPDLQTYVLDRDRQPVPVGVVGELYVGGAGVARGYLNRPELTAERFVRNPFSNEADARLYKTGDLARWRADGSLEYLGRNDDQVKIRGFRIELGEIEAQLARHSLVREAAVIARDDVPGEKRLVAYLTAEKDSAPDVEDLRAYLKVVLPEHMIPSAFVILDQLPLTSNGKLDRRALPAPELGAYVSRKYEAPQGEVEEILAGIWQGLLRIERVGRQNNFFELGGHSLLIVQMLERLRRVGLSADVRRVFESPTLADLASVLTRGLGQQFEVPPNLIPAECGAITPAMLPLIQLDVADIDRIVHEIPGGAPNIQDIYPLAPLQEGILFHHLLNKQQGDVYVVPILLALPAREKLEEFIGALQQVIGRHDILRTAVLWEQLPRPLQVVQRNTKLPVEELGLSSDQDPLVQIHEWMKPEHQNIDLRQAPLMRLKIAKDPKGSQWYALLQFHHLVCDHESLVIMLSEVAAHLQGGLKPVPESVPYRNYVAQALAHAEAHDADSFFRSKLADIDEPTAPFGLLDVHGDGSQIEDAHEELEPAFAKRIRDQARRLNVSSATLFHAAWGLVVARTSGRDDVVYGSVLLGRLQGSAGAQRILGMFINTLPLRLKIQGLSAKELVELTQREVVELLSHEQASLAVAQRCSGISGSAPLFSTLLNYRHSVANPEADWASAADIQVLAGQERTNYPISISVDDLGEGFSLTAQTDRQIDPRRITGYLRTAVYALVEALEQSPGTKALSLPVLPAAEIDQVLRLFNKTDSPYAQNRLLHSVCEEQVARTPNAIAITQGSQSLTYAELNARANQLARHLLARGVEPDQLVAICAERSIEMVVGLLGVLKAGGAYVPLDPSYPSDRLEYMLADAVPRVLLTQEKLRAELPASAAEVIALDSGWSDIAPLRSDNLDLSLTGLRSHHLAYVIYTSGSTGKPKGVMVSHRNVLNLVHWHYAAFDVKQGSRCSSVAAVGFDAAAWEIWSSLSAGATLMLAPAEVSADPEALIKWWGDEPLDVSFLPTPMAEFAFGRNINNPTLRTLLVGGDRLRARPTSLPFSLINNYGPTESTVVATSGPIDPDDAVLHIGRPIANTQIYILDSHLQPVPVGVAGELYIGGSSVARGYLNRPDLTKERFLPDPFGSDPQAHIYKSGDLARWQADGTVEYLGRNDHQVKIRGFRIELGEIETRLASHEQVREAVVIAREDVPGEKRLVAYLVAQTELASLLEDLRAHVKAALPDYMVPAAFVVMDQFPLTSNGKLDRRALPAPEAGSYATRDYQAPEGEVEEILASIWQELLRVDRIGRQDNFFELGGHSLLIVQMLERLRRVGLTAEVRRVFNSPTLADLARALTKGVLDQFKVPANLIPADCEAITPAMLPLVELTPDHIERIVKSVPGGALNIQDIYPLAPLQEGIFFHHLLTEQRGDVYVVPMLLSLSSKEKMGQFVQALQQVIDRHDILRTAVLWEELPRSVQVVYRKASLPVSELTLDPNRDAIAQLTERMRPEEQRLDLRQAPLMRLQIAADPHDSRWYALLQLHHIGGDTSLKIAISEVVSHLEGLAHTLPESVPYRNHVAQSLANARTHEAEEFFRAKLGDVDEPTAPFGLLDVHGDGSQIAEVYAELDASLAQRVRVQARRLGVSVATLFHSAWGLVVAHTSGRDDVVYGSVLLGRLQGSAGSQRILGMFINTLPLRLQLRDLSAKELVEQTQRGLVELLSHEQASLSVAQRCSGISGTAPLFTALLNYRHGVANPEADWASAAGLEVLGGQYRTNYPISLSIDDLGEGFALTTQTDLRIDAEQVTDYMRTALRSLVEALELSPQRSALDLSVLPAAEYQRVLREFNDTEFAYPRERLIHELFEEQAARTPDAIAVAHGDHSLTYAELNRRSNQLAGLLRSRGLGSNELAATCVERSAEMVVGLLGILKAGGAYVPLDPNYPIERLQHMLEDAAPRVVLTQEKLKFLLPATVGGQISLDSAEHTVAIYSPENLSAVALGQTSRNLVYVIYTSGSTGRPKGTAMSHRSMVNLIEWHRKELPASGGIRVLQFAALSFDVAFQETFSTLCTGGTLVLLDEWVRRDAQALLELLNHQRIERLFMPPIMLQTVAESLASAETVSLPLRDVITAGEQLRITPEVVSLFRKLDGCRLHNHYGPTESHVVTTLTLAGDPANWPTVPAIGKPIANTQMYVLDKRRQPVPLGIAGEIYIGGAGVAQGYLGRPELTEQRFLADPFSPETTARLYKTGDLGQWRSDGSLEYLGRNDDQVKIRGFRVELGEIESRLATHESVQEVVVIAREDVQGEKRLVAYIVSPDGKPSRAEELREHVKAALPDHMIPSAFVSLSAFPLTPSGKLDKRALPAPELGAYVNKAYEPPQGQTEEVLAEIWRDLLRVERVGRDDNFFELGGHSLLGMKLIARSGERFGMRLSVVTVFQHPTIQQMARVVESLRPKIEVEFEEGFL